ncbi:aminopeptidase N [Simkania negevensis]|uniref:Aminopeptidase N n=1 Tax=Simkania negevensis TaxID=83561 RepID=A0ABS3API4_9BACT|nr:aminopeptidase N [Simkania negevensis]
MKTTTPTTIDQKDYTPPTHLVSSVDLCFDLDDTNTLVQTRMEITANPAAKNSSALTLNGENILLKSVKINGKQLANSEYDLTDTTLTITSLPQRCTLEIENVIDPQGNTALDGLYKAGGIFCTQNEPEGFRRITYFLDRSDVMASFKTKIIADKKLHPVLLSNGNLIAQGDLPTGKHWAEWEDPFKKPCYLFALVAGDLGCIEDCYTTAGGRDVTLKIYCDKGNESRCYYAMEALKKSMKWDEKVFGLEYDLDIYMIVAVDSFNMGAMENKGLNIFNTVCVLADEKTATDDNFLSVEAVIAHEYFHNWTGNRVTCRDWFQLTLKEGLTVFRDQEFTSDMHSRAVKRIDDVQALRIRQFPEEEGPMAHSIKPNSYIAVNNFYTTTIYEKGAEVIRMIHTLIGKEEFRKGIDRYFELFDGQAVTTEDFVRAMEEASGYDLTQFKRWYSQAGTPQVNVEEEYNSVAQTLKLTVKQSSKPTADGSAKDPLYFPLTLGLIDSNGNDIALKIKKPNTLLHGSTLVIKEREQQFLFEEVPQNVTLSLNRNFSAPIKLSTKKDRTTQTFLMAHDKDPFNRWDAAQELATAVILQLVNDIQQNRPLALDDSFAYAFGIVLDDHTIDYSFKSRMLQIPTETVVAQQMETIDFDAIHQAREFVVASLAKEYEKQFTQLYHSLQTKEDYSIDSNSIGRRTLKNRSLGYLSHIPNETNLKLCFAQYSTSTNMTDAFFPLTFLAHIDCKERNAALKDFYDKWHNDTLVIIKWFRAQALSKLPNTLQQVEQLLQNPAYNEKIPNIVRSLIAAFTQNHIHFHSKNGEGYSLLTEQILRLDPINPQIAASLVGAFKILPKLDKQRKSLVTTHLQRILQTETLSTNVYEIASKTLAH